MGFSCLFSLLVAGAPRLALILLWIFRPERIDLAFDNFLLPIVGLLFLPIVTFVYVLIAPEGVQGLDWLWLGLAMLADLGLYAAGAYINRRRLGRQG
jgi:CDP-diglyceride synthetase